MSGFERLLIGRTVGQHYRIEEVLGDGGFGVVFRATDLRPGRARPDVALKVLKVPVRTTPEEMAQLRARFRREASYAALLPPHPGIVPIHDYGTDPELDRDFIVMELLEGEDLRTRLLRPEPIPLPEALRILRDAARALAVGHAVGLIHRDVKPGNLFLAHPADGGEPTVRVLDFGIAKPLAQDAEHTATHLTRDGRAPLSGRYAAPEQIAAERDLTCAVDVFALGVVGFELLTRTRLFTDADQSRREAGLPVPVPSLRARNPEVPAEVEVLVRRALAHDPRERFSDAGVLARALQRVGARLHLHLDPAPTLERERQAAPAAPVDVTALAGAASTTGDATALADDPTALADAHTALAEERRAVPEPPPGMRRRLARRLAPLSRRMAAAAVGVGVLAMGGSAVMQLFGEDAGAAAVAPAKEFVAPAVEAASANQEGLRLFRERDYPGAAARFRHASRLVPDNAEYRNNEGYALYRAGRADEAVRVLEEVVERYPDRHVAYANLADAYLLRGDTLRAVATLEALLALEPPRARRTAAEWVLERIVPGLRPEEPAAVEVEWDEEDWPEEGIVVETDTQVDTSLYAPETG